MGLLVKTRRCSRVERGHLLTNPRKIGGKKYIELYFQAKIPMETCLLQVRMSQFNAIASADPFPVFNPIKEEVTTVPVSEDVTYYERYSRRELHVYFRRWLENAAMAEEDPEKLRANLISMISRFGDRVFKQDRGHDRASTDTTSDPAPPLSPWLQYQGFTFSSDLSASAVGMPPMDIPLMIPSPENMKSTLRDCCFEWPYCTCIRWDQYGVNQFPLKSAVTNTDAPACDPRDPDLNQQFWQDLDGQMSSLVPSCDPDLDWLTSFLGDRPT